MLSSSALAEQQRVIPQKGSGSLILRWNLEAIILASFEVFLPPSTKHKKNTTERKKFSHINLRTISTIFVCFSHSLEQAANTKRSHKKEIFNFFLPMNENSGPPQWLENEFERGSTFSCGTRRRSEMDEDDDRERGVEWSEIRRHKEIKMKVSLAFLLRLALNKQYPS